MRKPYARRTGWAIWCSNGACEYSQMERLYVAVNDARGRLHELHTDGHACAACRVVKVEQVTRALARTDAPKEQA